MSTMTSEQLDAIMAARAAGAKHAGKKAADVAAALKAEGHPLFVEGGAKPAPRTAIDIDPGPVGGLGGAGANGSVAIGADQGKPGADRATTTAIAPAPKTTHAVAKRATAVEGMEDLDGSDFQLPTLALCQSQSKIQGADVPEGHWYYRQQPQTHSAVRKVVILAIKKGRSFMLPYAKDQRPAAVEHIRSVTGQTAKEDHEGPLCFSRDRVHPVAADGMKPFAVACADCSFAKWRRAGGASVMDCSESYDLLLLDVTNGADGGVPVMSFQRGAGIKPMKTLNTNLLAAAAQHGGLPTFAFELEMSSAKVKTDDGNYAVPVWSYPKRITDEERVARYAGIRAGCLAAQEHAPEVPA